MSEISKIGGNFNVPENNGDKPVKKQEEDTEKTVSLFNAIKNYNQNTHAVDTEDNNFSFSLYEKASEAVSSDEKKNVMPQEKDYYDKNGNFDEKKYNKAMDKYNKNKEKINEKYTKNINKQLKNKENTQKLNDIVNKYTNLGVEIPTPFKDESYNTEGKMASAESKGYLPESFKVADLETQKSILKEIGINPDDCEVMPNYGADGKPDGTYCFKSDNAFIKIGTDESGNFYQAITELDNGIANTTSRKMTYVQDDKGVGKKDVEGKITYFEPPKTTETNKEEVTNTDAAMKETNTEKTDEAPAAEQKEKTQKEILQDEIAALKQEQDEAYFSGKKQRLQKEIDEKEAELAKLEKEENKTKPKTEKNPVVKENPVEKENPPTEENTVTPEKTVTPEEIKTGENLPTSEKTVSPEETVTPEETAVEEKSPPEENPKTVGAKTDKERLIEENAKNTDKKINEQYPNAVFEEEKVNIDDKGNGKITRTYTQYSQLQMEQAREWMKKIGLEEDANDDEKVKEFIKNSMDAAKNE